jgi:CRP-like cAMP-binding protein
MHQMIADELNEIDRAFAGNRLLSTFPAEARALVEPRCEIVQLRQGDTVFQPGELLTSSLFPFGQTIVCMVVELNCDRTVQVASVGREGAIGGIISCGEAPAFSHAKVLISGPALKVSLEALHEAKQRNEFIANIFCRFADYLLSKVMQSVACNAFHSIPQRAARWLLLTQDRAGDRIELTQEELAGLLGVQRTTVNAVIRDLQGEGLVSSSRGAIHVIDRAGLKRRACECYSAVDSHFSKVIGPGGIGGIRAG